jgi:hypothetical protein
MRRSDEGYEPINQKKEREKVMDKATDNSTVIDGKKVPYKLPATDPAKSKTQGQKAVQVKKVPFKGVF